MSAFHASRALRVIQHAHRPGKQNHFIKNLFTDSGNIPLVIANGAGLALVIGFGMRKLVYHPDIGLTDATRFNDACQNEPQSRLDDADAFRRHHIWFSGVLEPIGNAFVSFWTGTNGRNSPKWQLNFAQTPVHELVPLERTNFFDDGMYEKVKASDYALNEDNQDMTKYAH